MFGKKTTAIQHQLKLFSFLCEYNIIARYIFEKYYIIQNKTKLFPFICKMISLNHIKHALQLFEEEKICILSSDKNNFWYNIMHPLFVTSQKAFVSFFFFISWIVFKVFKALISINKNWYMYIAYKIKTKLRGYKIYHKQYFLCWHKYSLLVIILPRLLSYCKRMHFTSILWNNSMNEIFATR